MVFYLIFFNLESRSYQIEVVTSGHEEITVIRLSPKAVQQAVEETFRNNIKVSEATYIHTLIYIYIYIAKKTQ